MRPPILGPKRKPSKKQARPPLSIYFLLVSILKINAVLSEETSMDFYRHELHYNSEGYRCENLSFEKCNVAWRNE
jgi:hypothetical protein